MTDTRNPLLQRARKGWVALGPGFYVWQEDEPSARMWLEALSQDPSRPANPPPPPGRDRG